MRVAVVGGGPAGLYFSALWKRRHPADEVRLFEQNAADATWGFGVVFSDQALEFLRDDDPETVAAIAPHMQGWRDIAIVHRGERVVIDGVGFSAIGRLELLRLLQERAREAGVDLRFGTQLTSLDELGRQDLIVAADGVNSLVRRTFEREFGFTLEHAGSKFAWYGTTKPFDTLTQTFVANELGTFNAHHYRYAPGHEHVHRRVRSGDVGARGARQGRRAGEPHASARRCSRRRCGGHALVSNRSIWRNFPWVANARWSYRNCVLIGDALHTAHYSIGSGTRLALEDALALVKALEAEPGDLAAGLARYEASRRPIAGEAGRGIATVGGLVRPLPRAHAACAARSGHELHPPLGPHRRRPAAGHVAALHGPL